MSLQSAHNFSPLETLIRYVSPTNTALFVLGTSVVREVLSSCDGITILPLRGAMPIVWGAEGASIEPADASYINVEVPVGSYMFLAEDGSEHTTSVRKDLKKGIIKDAIMLTVDELCLDPHETQIAILDEVQKGGTLSQVVRATRKVVDEIGFNPRLKVVAAQDIRKGVSGERKVDAYLQLASNSVGLTPTTVLSLIHI